MSGAEQAALLERLGTLERPALRRACQEAIERLRTDPPFVEPLRRLMREGSPVARFAAAFALFREGGRPGLGLLPALLGSLELADGDLRWEAAHMLVMLGRLHGEVTPVLIDAARNAPNAVRRRMALYVLRELAPERPETRDAMLAALDDSVSAVRHAALTSIAKLHEPGREVLGRVLALLDSRSDPRARRLAAVLLPRLAQTCQAIDEARSALELAERDADPSLVQAATLGLRRLAEPG